VTFVCCTTLTVIWYYESKGLPKNAINARNGIGYSELTILGVKKMNSGKYVCRAYESKRLKFVDEAELVVTSKSYYLYVMTR